MNKDDLEFFSGWFDRFVAGFASDDPLISRNIALKEEHTAQVRQEAIMIASKLALPEQTCLLAETAALLHDVGRFPQMKIYRTFNDYASEDHAKLGIRTITAAGILTRLNQQEQSLLLTAISCHNMKFPPSELPPAHRQLVNIIRDADKLDILRVVTDYYPTYRTNKNPALEYNLPESDCYSPAIIKDILANRMASIEDVRSAGDARLIKLSWIFDLNFPVSLQAFLQRQYLEKTLPALPDTVDTRKIFQHLHHYMVTKNQPM